MVAYLEKLEANADFAKIVDFLNASPFSYALTIFDGKTIVITESSVRRDLHFDDEDAVFNDEYDTPSHTKKVFANIRRKGKDFSGTVTPLFPSMLASQVVEGEGSGQPTELQHTPTIASPSHVEPIPTTASSSHLKKTHKYEAVYKERGDSVERAVTTVASLDAEQTSGNIIRTQSIAIPNVPFPQGIGSCGVNTPRSDEERIELKELMDMCIKLFDRVLDLENVKDAQALEIKKVYKPRVEFSEESLGEKDASKQGKNSDNIEELNVAKDEHMFDLSDLAGTEVVLKEEPIELVEDKGSAKKGVSAAKDKDSTVDPVTTTCETVTTASVNQDDVTLAETLMTIRSSASRPQKLKGVLFKEPSEPTTITTSRPQPQILVKDKGKGIMQEPEKLVKVKGKDQIEYDADVAQSLQAKLDEEARLEREREEEASNAALIKEWDSIKARINADAQLAERLQVEEREQMSVEEQARLLMEIIAAKKKFFAHMAGYKDKKFKGKSFDAIKKMFDKAYKQVNAFVPMDTKSNRKKVDSSGKKA
ncbi:hypothetical protein Tco_1206844, partial [Tanacetum coccineum]